MSSIENLRLLQEFDNHVEEVIFTADCTAWNEKRSSQFLDGLLFIVKRTIEPRFQIILQPAWPVNTDADLCGFRLEESFDQSGRFEELKPRFLLPSQGIVVFFNNLEDSTRAAECIKGLVDTTAPTGDTTEITEVQRDSGIDPSVSIQTNEITEEQKESGTDPSVSISIGTNEITEEQKDSGIDPSVSIQTNEITEEQKESGTDPSVSISIGTNDITEEQRESGTDPSVSVGIGTNEITEEQKDSGIDPSVRVSIRSNEITEEQRHSGTDPSVSAGIWTNVVASGTPENNNPQVWDEKIYLQNTRVIMAMIAVLLATIVLSVGLNPPSSINTLAVKIIFQITFWIAAIFSLAALFVLGVVTPTSFEMQGRIFRCGLFAISVAMVCVLVAFGATTISIATNLFTGIVGVFIGAIGVIMFSYFTSKTVRDFIFTFLKFRLTQNANDIPYWLTNL